MTSCGLLLLLTPSHPSPEPVCEPVCEPSLQPPVSVRVSRLQLRHEAPARCVVMQQKLCSRGTGSLFQDRTSPAASEPSEEPPYSSHSYCSPDVSLSNFSITGTLPDPSTAAIPWYDMSLPTRRGPAGCTGRPPHIRSLSDSRDSGYPHSYASVRRRTQSVGVGTHTDQEEEEEEEEEDDGSEEEDEEHKKSASGHHHHHHHYYNQRHLRYPPPSPLGRPPDPDPDMDQDLDLMDQSSYCDLETAAASAAVRRRLAHFLRATDSSMQRRLATVSTALAQTDSSMQRRLATVSTALAQTDTELLCQRAHSQHLAQERSAVADRERSLSRQVDVAVMVIAALREQLNASENELERREREAITIQKFLEAAARQETSGKVRIQLFIEGLLSRIALAEQLLEDYHNSPQNNHYNHYNHHNHYKHQPAAEHGLHRISKSRSAAGPLSSSFPDSRSQCGGHMCRGPLPAACVERDLDRERRDRLAHSSRLFCRPEHRDGIWNHQRRRSAGYEA